MKNWIDLTAVVISLGAFAFSITTFIIERFYRKKSLDIGCDIIEKYHNDNVAVMIVNRGVNVISIDSISVKKNGEVRDNLITFMPKLNQNWKGFSLEIRNRNVLPNEEIVLCAINPKTEEIFEKMITTLYGIEIIVKYSDVYGKKHKSIQKNWNIRNSLWKIRIIE